MAFKCTFITRRGPEHNGAANHALVFMLADISSRLKQTVAYYFTGDSVKEDTFKTIIIEIISKAEALGLKVNLVTSDMGACNKSMRKRFGIYCLSGNTRHTQNSTVHPCDSNHDFFYFTRCATFKVSRRCIRFFKN